MKSRSGSRFTTISKLSVTAVLLVLAACESKSTTTTAAATTTTTSSTTTTTTTIPGATNNGKLLVVGDTGPGGGAVIYISTTTFACGVDLKSKCNAIESAPSKWWKNVTVPSGCGASPSMSDPRCTWDREVFDYGSREFLDEAGGGRQNTNFMLEAKSPAATMATGYRGGNFDDWYLPSKTEAEMQCLFDNGFKFGGVSSASSCIGGTKGDFMRNYYMTSTLSEKKYASGKSETKVWWLSFEGNDFLQTTRSEFTYLRPVRAFLAKVAASTSATTTTVASTTTRPKSTTTVATATCGQSGGTCTVGDTTVNGGKVFYVSSAGFNCGATMADTCHYLEVADASWRLSVVSPCASSGNYSVLCPWGASSESYVQNDSHIGGGLKSSIAVSSANGNTGGFAAIQAMALRAGGKADWYLPSLDELRELCKYANGQATGTGASCTKGTLLSDFVSEAYWSSTDGGLSKVNVVNFGDPAGGGSVIPKDGTAQTRPIRAF